MILDEFRLIGAIKRAVRGPIDPRVEIGIGDDAAVLSVKSGRLVATTDALVEGVHFRFDMSRPADVGSKAAAVNLSDLAAMGARPLALLVALEVPNAMADRDVVSAMRGLAQVAAIFGASVVGGNVSSGPVFTMTVTALGEPCAGRVLTRAGAQPGDVVMVGGPLGSGALGLDLLEHNRGKVRTYPELVRRYRRPEPQVELGMRLAAEPGVDAAIDLSDGLASDLGHVLAASCCGARIDADRIPMHVQALRYARLRGLDARIVALTGGDDYLLLVAAKPEVVTSLLSAGMTAIGCVTKRRGLVIESGGSRLALPAGSGWRHR